MPADEQTRPRRARAALRRRGDARQRNGPVTSAQCSASPRCQLQPGQWYRGMCKKHYRAWRAVNRPVDSEIVAEHIAVLRAARMGCIRISQLSGVPRRTVSRIANGHSTITYAEVARAILAVNPAVDRPAHMNPIGAIRRLRALVAHGHTRDEILAAMGERKLNLHRYLNGTAAWIFPGTHDRIDAAFRTLSVQPPPAGRSADRARMTATKHGYLPALAWDLETIDDPDARPHVDAIRPAKPAAVLEDFRIEYLELRDEFGLTDAAIAERLDISVALLGSRLSRLRIPMQQSRAAS
ncbi:MAG: hypothetical protein K2Y33_11400 [Mycolicibacterium frederiksbergense]|nr:hypothetical protein [Mycolicibacterium frederiksbergense]